MLRLPSKQFMLKLTSYAKNPNIGVFGRAAEELAFIPKGSPEKFKEEVRECLNVEPVELSINESGLIGSMAAANTGGIVFPKIALKREINELKRNKSSINIGVLSSKYTALGNLIAANDKGAVASRVFSKKDVKEIEDVLGVEVLHANIGRFKIVGTICVPTNKGALIHSTIREEEIKRIEEVIKVRIELGSINQGSGYIRAGIIANSKGALIGEKSTSPEIARIEDALELE